MHISNRQQFVKRALKIIAFVLLAVLLLEGMSKVLMPRSNSGSGGMHNYRARGFYGEEKNSLDIVAIGNSDLASGFSPMELWKSHGIAGFACGEPNQTIDQSVRLLQEILTCQKPKVVILETDTLFQENMEGHLTSLVKTAVNYLFPVLEYHDRWKSVTLSELMGKQQKPWHDPGKGYRYSGDRVAYKGGDYMAETKEKEEIDAIAMKSLDQFVEICQEAGIQVMFMEMPSANSWNMARHRAVVDYASSRNISFIDFNMKDRMKETGFDWMTDSRDGGNHLNYSGAKKISVWLGDYLAKDYQLEDHRKDSRYQRWQQDVSAYDRIALGAVHQTADES